MSSVAIVERDLLMSARDGVVLATDVYRPEGDGPFPTLIYRVRGSRSAAFITGLLMVNPLEAVRRGYAVVIQEVRGRAGSEARWHPFVHERSDGEDCLNWVLAQPWCDGRLGSYGTAYSAETALALAALGRDELKALVVLGTGADYHDGWVYTNGAFELGWNIYWAYMTLSESISRLDIDEAERAELKREYAQALISAAGCELLSRDQQPDVIVLFPPVRSEKGSESEERCKGVEPKRLALHSAVLKAGSPFFAALLR